MSGVHSMFEARAARHPDAIALVEAATSRTMTYGALDACANAVAAQLAARGVEQGALVGLMAGRSLEMIAGMLGILKAGAAYVPLDPTYPRERLDFMIADAAMSVCVADAAHAHVVGARAAVLVLEDCAAAGANDAPARGSRSRAAGSEDPAYVIYTSGSTGRPKGVVVPHRGIVRLVSDVSYARLDESRVTLQLAPISFDAATFEIWGALLNGGRCVLAPSMGVPDLALLRRTIVDHGVTTMWLTASLFNMVVDRAPDTLRTLDEVLTGGEALSVPHIRRARSLLPHVQLINGYGPTESTTFTCCFRIPEAIPAEWTSIPIGHPIERTTVHLLDGELREVAAGAAGDLFIGGAGLALGYLNRPELTAERFIEHPLGRLYRSGDRARRMADGALEFLGRLDDQVKVRGHRIELGEIEAALRQVSSVADAAVTVHDDAAGERHLVAYYTANPGAAHAKPEVVRARLAERLPVYMVPTLYVPLDAIPVTANGKADRRALPAPAREPRAGERQTVSPRTAVERWLAGLWRETLALDEVGVHDRFFELGGTSLSAMRLLERLREETGTALPALVLFRAATVAELATLLEREYADALPAAVVQRVAPAMAAAGAASRADQRAAELRERRMRRRNG